MGISTRLRPSLKLLTGSGDRARVGWAGDGWQAWDWGAETWDQERNNSEVYRAAVCLSCFSILEASLWCSPCPLKDVLCSAN